ncbi:MAG: hypothetical protein ACRYFX_18585 [Janthinobacterium lividum]
MDKEKYELSDEQLASLTRKAMGRNGWGFKGTDADLLNSENPRVIAARREAEYSFYDVTDALPAPAALPLGVVAAENSNDALITKALQQAVVEDLGHYFWQDAPDSWRPDWKEIAAICEKSGFNISPPAPATTVSVGGQDAELVKVIEEAEELAHCHYQGAWEKVATILPDLLARLSAPAASVVGVTPLPEDVREYLDTLPAVRDEADDVKQELNDTRAGNDKGLAEMARYRWFNHCCAHYPRLMRTVLAQQKALAAAPLPLIGVAPAWVSVKERLPEAMSDEWLGLSPDDDEEMLAANRQSKDVLMCRTVQTPGNQSYEAVSVGRYYPHYTKRGEGAWFESGSHSRVFPHHWQPMPAAPASLIQQEGQDNG